MLTEAFGEHALSQAGTFEWFKRFKDGQESVEDDKHSGRPSTCTTPEMIAEVLEVILEDRSKKQMSGTRLTANCIVLIAALSSAIRNCLSESDVICRLK